MLDKLFVELEEKLEKVDVREVHGIVMGTLMKGYDFRKIGEVQFNDGGMPSSQVHRTGFYHDDEDITIVIESTQDYHSVVENNVTSYEPEHVVRVEAFEGLVESSEDLEFLGHFDCLGTLVKTEFEN